MTNKYYMAMHKMYIVLIFIKYLPDKQDIVRC